MSPGNIRDNFLPNFSTRRPNKKLAGGTRELGRPWDCQNSFLVWRRAFSAWESRYTAARIAEVQDALAPVFVMPKPFGADRVIFVAIHARVAHAELAVRPEDQKLGGGIVSLFLVA